MFGGTEIRTENHMYRATVKHRFSNCDQVNNISKLVGKWLREATKNKLCFKPYADIGNWEIDPTDDEDGESNKDNENNHKNIKITKKCTRQTMMFIHKTKPQCQLLSRYGSDIGLTMRQHSTDAAFFRRNVSDGKLREVIFSSNIEATMNFLQRQWIS